MKKWLGRDFLILVCAAAWLVSGGPVRADETFVELSLRDCIDRALEENLSFRSSRLGLRIDRLSIVQAESAFDPAFTLSVDRGHSETPTYFDYYGVSSIQSKQTRLNLTLNKNISTGAEWGMGLYNTLSESNIERAKNYTSYFGISVNQPLLKGFGRKVNESTIYLGRIQSERTKHDIENTAVDLVYRVEQAYWNLHYALESLQVKEIAVAQAESLLAYNRKGLDLGVLTRSDVLEAVLAQKTTIMQAEDSLRRLINMTSGNDWNVRIVTSDRPSITPVDVDLDEALDRAVKQRPDVQVALRDIEQYELQESVALNGLKPDLDLSARYNIIRGNLRERPERLGRPRPVQLERGALSPLSHQKQERGNLPGKA